MRPKVIQSQKTPKGTNNEKRSASSPLELNPSKKPDTKQSPNSKGMETPSCSIDKEALAARVKEIILPELLAAFEVKIDEIVDKAVQEATTALSMEYDEKISNLTTRNNEYDEKISKLTSRNNELEVKCDSLERNINTLFSQMDACEQYSRRNNVRISGIPVTDGENTNMLVVEVARDMGVLIGHMNSIDRSHRIGKKQDIIVKFTNFELRDQILRKRKLLKTTRPGVYINEDLTITRSRLLYLARQKANNRYINTAYSLQGNIYVIDNNAAKLKLTSQEQLANFDTQRPEDPQQSD